MLSRISSVHFIGICGTAMASAAAAMQEKGVKVTGSDQNVYPPMSTFLAERRIEVIAGYSEHNLAHKPDLIVVGNAISRGNPEAEYVLDRKLRYCSLPELLKDFFIQGKRSLVVSGTHGKTTTTSLLTWVFEHNGLNPSYLIGGMPNNLGQGARFTESEWFIIEGDEYDTAFFDKRSKFVHYLPEVAIINNLEFDHADIFKDLESIQTSFKHFIRLVPRNGLLLGNGDDANLAALLNVTHCPVKRFGLGEHNWLGDRSTVLGCLIVVTVWKEAGFFMIFYLAALQQISPSLGEAAAIEGAGRWYVFRRVTFPLLMPTTLFVLVNAVINSFRLIDHIVAMTRGGPDNASALLLFYIYQVGFRYWDTGYAAALTVVLLAILAISALIQFAILEKRVHYQ